MREPLRVASLNVLRLSRRELDRSAQLGAFVGALRSDLVALQEIEQEPAVELAAHAGYAHHTFVRHAPIARRGVALLHRAPAIASSGQRIAARLGDDKGYTRAVVEAGGRTLELVGIHLDWLSYRARMRQIERLALALGPPTMPRLVVGDLNAMTPSAWARGEPADETVLALSLALGVRPPSRISRSYPSRAPRWALDWVLASADLALGEVEVVPTPLSDHAAVVAEVA